MTIDEAIKDFKQSGDNGRNYQLSNGQNVRIFWHCGRIDWIRI